MQYEQIKQVCEVARYQFFESKYKRSITILRACIEREPNAGSILHPNV